MKRKTKKSSGPVVVNLQPSPYSEIDQVTFRMLGIVEPLKRKEDVNEVSQKPCRFHQTPDCPTSPGEVDQ